MVTVKPMITTSFILRMILEGLVPGYEELHHNLNVDVISLFLPFLATVRVLVFGITFDV